MKQFYFLPVLLFIFNCSCAQDTVWRRNGVAALNISQVGLSNWAAGGQSSIAGNAIINYSANYTNKNITWDNLFDFAYGGVVQGKKGSFVKTEDKMEITSKFGRKAFEKFYYSGLMSFRSQFATGYNQPADSVYISTFLSPAYISFAAGMDYKPEPYLSLFVSPVSLRYVVVNDKKLSDAGAFGVEKGRRLRIEAGALFRAIYKKDISPTVNTQVSVELFSDYTRKPENIDVNTQLLLAVKVGRYVSVTASAQLLYDHDTDLTFYKSDGVTVDRVGPGIQVKEVVGIGFSYKFSAYTTR